MKLKYVKDKHERNDYWDKAIEWAAQQDWAYYEADRYPAIKGVAEYLANQNGETVFEGWDGREYKL